MTEENKVSSFAVALQPEFDEDSNWTGSVSASLEEELAGDLDDDAVTQIRHVTGMLATCLQIMETDTEFLEYVKNYYAANNAELFMEFLDELEEEEEQPKFTRSKDGKVITLHFDTKTYGNA